MSYLFSGSVQVTADDKNRFRFPAKYKDVYAAQDDTISEIYVLKTLNAKYLTVFSKEVGEKFVRDLNKMSTLRTSTESAMAEYYLQNLELCKVDSQGRFIVPQKHAGQINLGKEAVICGVGAKLRIWNKAEYDANEIAQAKLLEEKILEESDNRTALDDLVFGVD